MGWYLGSVWKHFGHFGLFIISIFYFVLFTFVGNFLWKKEKKTPAGLLYVCAVSTIPVIVWALESLIGIMPKDFDDYGNFHKTVRAGWIFMEIATILVGCIFLKYRKVPLLTLPICFCAWYLSMDLTPILLGQITEPTWAMRKYTTLVFSIILIFCGLELDKKKTLEDFSHWLYIFGGTMLWSALNIILHTFKHTNEFTHFVLAIINIIFMLSGIILKRRVFIVWGAIGFWGYLSRLAFKIFANTPLFPIVLVLLGLGIIFSGIYYSKNFETIEQKIKNLLNL